MASLIDKIELLIKREKTTPDKKKNDDTNKSSNEILSELFGAFNATPPVLDETLLTSKKSKKSKKKHKKEKKKRSRSSSSSDSDASEYNRKRKKKKSKHKKRKHSERDDSPPRKIKIDPELLLIKPEILKLEKVKEEPVVKTETVEKRKLSIKLEDDVSTEPVTLNIDASSIPMPDSPKEKLDSNDLRNKLDNKGKIQIKNLKFSTVFEETVKKAEEEARIKAAKYEDGEYTDSSSSSGVEEVTNSEFPKSADPGGILKKNAEDKLSEDERTKKKHSERSSRKDRERSRKRSRSRSHRSRSGSRQRSRRRRSTSRGATRRSSSRSRRHRSRGSRERHRSRSGSRTRSRFWSRHLSPADRRRPRRSRSPTGVRLADSEKKRLLEVARRNAINMLKNGAVPAGAAALPPHTRSQVMAAIQSGGKSVDELTDFCKHLSKKEALGELSSHSSNGSDMSENEDTLAFHHPFLVKEKAPIVMNIRGGAPLPVKSAILPIANKEELRLQFPVSSGSQHREKAIEWRPVSPKKDNMQVAKLNAKPVKPVPAPVPPPVKEPEPQKTLTAALAAPPPTPPVLAPFMPQPAPLPPMPQPPLALTGVPAPLALPAPGPQAYPPGIKPPKPDISSIVSEKLLMIRKAQEENEISGSLGLGWSSRETRTLGQFTGSTGAQILTPRELASGTQAWAKKDQLTRAAPVLGGMGMHLLQKMGWTPGKGLGKEETGTLQPLLLEVKLDTRGLQAKEEGAKKGIKAQRGPIQRRPGGPPAPLTAGGKHPVSLLGEYCSKNKLGPPEYDLCFECGPDHKKNFLFKVKVAGTEYQPAVASINKKQAKADAAQLALQKLGILP